MEIETEFALFSKKIRLDALKSNTSLDQSTAPEQAEISNFVIPKHDTRFASLRETKAFVNDHIDQVTDEDLKILHVQQLHDKILKEKRRFPYVR